MPYRFLLALRDQLGLWPWVRQVWLFGSRARGDHHERSDIDLAIELDAAATSRQWHDLVAWFDERAPTLLQVDVVDLRKASEGMRRRVHEQGQVLFDRAAAG